MFFTETFDMTTKIFTSPVFAPVSNFSPARYVRKIAIMGSFMLAMGSVNAQFTKDPTYPENCKQNSDNPAGTYECQRINPDVAPYKSQWLSRVYDHPNYVDAFTDSPEEGRDLQLAAINADQERLQAAIQGTINDYPYRFIVDPSYPQCSQPSVSEYASGPSRSQRAISSSCAALQIDSRYQPGAPQYFINNVTLYVSKTASCEAGWLPEGAGPKDSIGRFISYPHVCYREETSKELGTKCPSCGNPINVATGNKYQVESDYIGTGPMPLQLRRHYNSASRQKSIDIGNNWRLEYDRRLKVEGTNSVWVTRPDGKIFYFLLKNGQWTPDSEVNDSVTPITDALNNIIGWLYAEASTLNIERYSPAGLLLSITDRAGSVTTLQYSDALTPMFIAPAPNMLIQVTDPFGHSIGITYGSGSRVATMVDPSGGIYGYGYDLIGNLVSVIRQDNSARLYL